MSTLALGVVGALVGLGVLRSVAPPPVHQTFPGAVVLAETTRPTGPNRVAVTRRYLVSAAYRDVVEWYQGKDSLMPVPAELKPGCFHQRFQRTEAVIPYLPFVLHSRRVEDVKVCATPRGTTITSVTTAHAPTLVR